MWARLWGSALDLVFKIIFSPQNINVQRCLLHRNQGQINQFELISNAEESTAPHGSHDVVFFNYAESLSHMLARSLLLRLYRHLSLVQPALFQA